MNRSRAILLLAFASILFSTSGLFVKIISISPLALVSARSIIAAIVIAIWLRRPHFTWSVAQVGGGIALALTQILFVISTRQTTAANAIFLQYTAPIYVAIFGVWFLGERAKGYDWLTMAAIAVGFVLFFNEKLSPEGWWGNVYAILSGVTLAWLLLFMRKQKDESTAETILVGNMLAAVIGLPALLTATPTPADWAGILFLGVVQLGISFIMMSVAIKWLTAVEAVLIQTLEPIFNPIWVFLVIGEAPSLLALAGGLVVLLAVTGRAVFAAREVRASKRPLPS
ncbi:MAG: DMT family transporter [Ardenticatenaceae bacterium]|nr:DMT family transporter [Ardenticatenaceae bacterium]